VKRIRTNAHLEKSKLRSRSRAVAALLLLLSLSACATTPQTVDHFESGDLGAALAAYGSDESAEALYFTAMIHLDQEWFNGERAASLLQQLEREFPENPYTRLGSLWLSSWRERAQLAADLERKVGEVDALRGETETLAGQLNDQEESASSRAGTIRDLRQRIEALEGEIGSLTQRLEEREGQLEELMSIDLDSEPLDTSQDPSQ